MAPKGKQLTKLNELKQNMLFDELAIFRFLGKNKMN